jgi:hypothetical protein
MLPQVPRCCGANSANNRDENYLEERTLQALVQARYIVATLIRLDVSEFYLKVLTEHKVQLFSLY